MSRIRLNELRRSFQAVKNHLGPFRYMSILKHLWVAKYFSIPFLCATDDPYGSDDILKGLVFDI